MYYALEVALEECREFEESWGLLMFAAQKMHVAAPTVEGTFRWIVYKRTGGSGKHLNPRCHDTLWVGIAFYEIQNTASAIELTGGAMVPASFVEEILPPQAFLRVRDPSSTKHDHEPSSQRPSTSRHETHASQARLRSISTNIDMTHLRSLVPFAREGPPASAQH